MLRKIINTFTSNFFIAVLNLLIAVAVSQYLGAAGKGQQSLLITTIAFIILICNVAGGASLVYLVPRYNNFKIILPAYTWTVLVCIVVYFLLMSFADIPENYIIHICILTLISSFTSVNSMILLGNEKIQAKNLIAVSQTFIVVFFLLFLFAVLQNKSIESYVTALYIGYITGFLLSCFYLFIFIDLKPVRQNSFKSLIKDMFRYGLLNQLSHIAQLLSIRVSYYILLIYRGEDEVGIYSNAVSLAEAAWLISKSIATVQYARISNTYNNAYAQLLSVKLLKTAFILSFFVLFPMVLLPSDFYILLFGNEFGNINRIIALLMPGVLVYNFAIILGHYFSGCGQYHINTFASLTCLIISILLYFILIPTWGGYGAAVAISLSFFVMSLFLLIVFLKKTELTLIQFLPDKNDINELKNIIKNNFNRKTSI